MQGSIVLECIDIGGTISRIMGYSELGEGSLSAAAIIPILDSIIDADGNYLLTLDIPTEWKSSQTQNKPPLCQFFGKFNQLLLS